MLHVLESSFRQYAHHLFLGLWWRSSSITTHVTQSTGSQPAGLNHYRCVGMCFAYGAHLWIRGTCCICCLFLTFLPAAHSCWDINVYFMVPVEDESEEHIFLFVLWWADTFSLSTGRQIDECLTLTVLSYNNGLLDVIRWYGITEDKIQTRLTVKL